MKYFVAFWVFLTLFTEGVFGQDFSTIPTTILTDDLQILVGKNNNKRKLSAWQLKEGIRQTRIQTALSGLNALEIGTDVILPNGVRSFKVADKKWYTNRVKGSATPPIRYIVDGDTVENEFGIWDNPNISVSGETVPFVYNNGRWVSEKPLTARDYGAKPNDNNSDVAALQKMLDSQPLCYIEKGRYIIDNTFGLALKSGNNVSGDGDSTVLVGMGSNQRIFNFQFIENFSIKNIRIVAASQSSTHNLFISACKNGTIENNTFDSLPSIGILVNGTTTVMSANITVNNNRFTNSKASDTYDVWLSEQTENCNVLKNSFNSGGLIAVCCENLNGYGVINNHIIANNTVSKYNIYGLIAYKRENQGTVSLVQNIQFLGNRITNIKGDATKGSGIYCFRANSVTIRDNTTDSTCLMTSDVTLAPAGIGLNSVNAAFVSNNTVKNSQYYGIYAVNSLGVNVLNNRIDSSRITDIMFNISKNVVLQGNTVRAKAVRALQISSVEVAKVTDNNIFTTASSASYTSNSRDIIFRGNTMEGGNYVFNLDNNSLLKITGNFIKSTGTPIVVQTKLDSTFIESNEYDAANAQKILIATAGNFSTLKIDDLTKVQVNASAATVKPKNAVLSQANDITVGNMAAYTTVSVSVVYPTAFAETPKVTITPKQGVLAWVESEAATGFTLKVTNISSGTLNNISISYTARD